MFGDLISDISSVIPSIISGVQDGGDLSSITDIASATAAAYSSPTLANINAVKQAYANNGSAAPTDLINDLMTRYYQQAATSSQISTAGIFGLLQANIVWVIGGIALIWYLSKKR